MGSRGLIFKQPRQYSTLLRMAFITLGILVIYPDPRIAPIMKQQCCRQIDWNGFGGVQQAALIKSRYSGTRTQRARFHIKELVI